MNAHVLIRDKVGGRRIIAFIKSVAYGDTIEKILQRMAFPPALKSGESIEVDLFDENKIKTLTNR